MSHIVLLHDDAMFAQVVAGISGQQGSLLHAQHPALLTRWLQEGKRVPVLALLDLDALACRQNPEQGWSLLRALLECTPAPIVLAVCAAGDIAGAARARAAGVIHVLLKPCGAEEVRAVIHSLRRSMHKGARARGITPDGIGTSPAQESVRQTIISYAGLPFPVLISGESGCGKEWVARGLHEKSHRDGHPFVCVNCAAITDTLFEAMVFGHARGAYTGAQQARAGFFEDAGPGTLFLDEVGELPLSMQAKLLRVLENGEYVRVGETRARFSEARIVAASNRDLASCVRAGTFRRDLFYRLSVLTIKVAPLRDRPSDKMALWFHFVTEVAHQMNTEPCRFGTEAEAVWMDYAFPGNVRELRNIVVRLQARHAGTTLTRGHLLSEFESHGSGGQSSAENTGIARLPYFIGQPDFRLDQALKQWELELIRSALQRADGNVSAAARLLGIHRTTLYNRLEGLQPKV